MVGSDQVEAEVAGVSAYLPDRRLGNEELTEEYPDWSVEKIEGKTGISTRWIAGEGECASDLGFRAAEKLFNTEVCSREDVDFLLFCTQSPDFFLPTTACLLQRRLGLRTDIGALDFNLGCSGYVYGLGLASGLVRSGQARNVLLITAETYSKFIHPGDRSVRTLFSDGAAATLVRARQGSGGVLTGPFVYGTDGRGGSNLIVPVGGLRERTAPDADSELKDDAGNVRTRRNLFMDGPEIFAFTLSAVPKAVSQLLHRSGKTIDDVDLYIFHQANQYMLEHLRKKLKIREEKFHLCLRDYGNTVSSTIPIALADAMNKGLVHRGATVMLVGFGVGYSWGATLLHWQ